MKINTNSNAYIITYSVVMVVIVAVLLTLAAIGLKPLQDKNVLEDNKSQIMTALGSNVKTTPYLINKDGEVIGDKESEVFAALKDLKASYAAEEYPIFVAEDGSVVVPLFGKGLWDAIWGFVALEPDMNTIKGIVLNHKGETPGLGAEIATPKHQAMYKGKTIFEGEQFVGITLKKGGADKDNLHEVDAITGGTKTSDGVTKMIQDCLSIYEPYFKAHKVVASAAEPAAEQVVAEPVVEQVIVEPAATEPVAVEPIAEPAVESVPEVQNTNDLNTENNG
jgi:Na+-transporting NADH:ubiquinone oxidoreductase subunit C